MGIKEKLIKVMSLNVVLWLLMLLVFSGLLLCAGGIYLLLAAQMTQVQALLITGGGLIAIVACLLLFVALSSSSTAKKTKANENKPVEHNSDNVLEHQLRPLLGNQATDWAKRNSGLAIVGALSAGVILAASPRTRAALMGAAGPLITRKAVKFIDQLTDDS